MSLKSLVFLLPLLTAGVDAAAAAKCAKNACYAQVSANRFAPPAFRSSGCYSFMASTVTPTAATVTKTVAAGFELVTPGPSCATAAVGPSQVPGYASSCANSAAYNSACQCFGITMKTRTIKRCTTTVLETTTIAGTTTLPGVTTGATSATSFVSVAAPTGCSNQGIAYAVYNNAETDSQTGYYNFDPTSYTTPVHTGSINQIQNLYVPDAQDNAVIYGQYVHSSDGFVINNVAYLFAPQSGTYKFTASNVNDIFNFWIGDVAYNGYTRENANLDTFFFYGQVPQVGQTTSGIPGSATYSVQLVGGLYYPMRYIFGQDVGAATFNFAITAPDGTSMFTSAQPNSPYLVRFSCDGAIAPAFPSFTTTTPVTPLL